MLAVEARRALAAAEAGRNAVAAVQGLIRGTLTIGVMQGLPPSVDLPEMLGRFHRKYPGVDIRLVQAGSEQLMDDLRAGRLDLAFPAVAGRPPQGCDHARARAEPAGSGVCDLTPAGEPASGDAGRSSRRRLRGVPARLGDPCAGRSAFADARLTRRRAFEVNDLCALTDLVAHGLGVAIVPHAVAADDARLRCVALRPSAPMWDVVVATAARSRAAWPPAPCWGWSSSHSRFPRPRRRLAGS